MSQYPTDDYTRAQRITIIVSCMLGFALDLYDVLLLPFLMPAIQRSLSMTLTEVASITSLTLIGSVIGGALFGWIGDRMGRRTSLQLTLGLFAVGSILSAFSTNYPTLAALRFLTGIGLGGEWGAGMVLFNETWNPRRRGLGSACIQGSAALASAAASIVAVWALTTFDPEQGWRVGLLTGGAPLVLMIAIRLWMPESKAWLAFDERRRGTVPTAVVRNAGNPFVGMFRPGLRGVTITAMSWMMAYMFCYYGVTVFIPTLMLKTLQTPLDVVRDTSVAYAVVAGIAFLGMGWLNDRFGRRSGALLPSLMWMASLVGLLVWGHARYDQSLLEWPIFWLYLLFGMGNASLGVAGTWLSELYPIEVRSTAVSTIYMAGRAVGSLAPVAVPAAATLLGGDLVSGMLICLPAAALFFVLSLLLPETRGRTTMPVQPPRTIAA
ncbi:MFS transporter [Methylobacterium sp. OT2]|uniref:MFS transporter n=1 Tax=Methylobacterium sp. OT2 TaxID=2813779 RepID=UPI001FEF25A1|nr:MFS transporter [Methylobacterium sp. OT2]